MPFSKRKHPAWCSLKAIGSTLKLLKLQTIPVRLTSKRSLRPCLLFLLFATLEFILDVSGDLQCYSYHCCWYSRHLLVVYAKSCCRRGLTDSYARNMTYSFGSICLGSLLVAILEGLRALLNNSAQNNDRGGLWHALLSASCPVWNRYWNTSWISFLPWLFLCWMLRWARMSWIFFVTVVRRLARASKR
jgi:hypothetical protein